MAGWPEPAANLHLQLAFEEMAVLRALDEGNSPKRDLKEFSPDELRKFMVAIGEPAFRGAQVFSWIHKRHVASFSDMTDLPLPLRTRLGGMARLTDLEILSRREGGRSTVKYLLGAHDGNAVEAVRMEYKHAVSACVSTQVGCKMACAFCASGIGGFVRDLSAAEILDQVLKIDQDLARLGDRVGNVVLMGTGEPLDNYDASIKALRILNAGEGLGISFRRMTVSTSGLVPGIERLAEEGIPVTLSISLHAPNDELREKLMPINRRYSIAEVMRAALSYANRTGRRVTFEYALIRNMNDSHAHARQLVALLRGLPVHVNLIPLSPVEEMGYRRPSRSKIMRFRGVLEDAGIAVTIRRGLGLDIDAACGQLRRGYCRQPAQAVYSVLDKDAMRRAHIDRRRDRKK